MLQDELLVRNQRQIDRRVKTASFREVKPLDDFDWSFNPSIPKKQVFDLATCRFVREARDVLLIGPSGTGKSYLAQAIGYLAIKQGLVVLYRSIFDVVRDHCPPLLATAPAAFGCDLRSSLSRAPLDETKPASSGSPMSSLRKMIGKGAKKAVVSVYPDWRAILTGRGGLLAASETGAPT